MTCTGAGVAVPASEPRALADAIERLSDDPEGRRRMGQSGRLAATGEYNRRRIFELFREKLEGSLEGRMRRGSTAQLHEVGRSDTAIAS